ncbi:helix-turn-helix domain-containing protein [Halocatena salina]|uniref:Helix-turn-helix domain-containing protein n=1 Tax=Halocatena salina TaxID=2934340 RepID=A0A8U0A1R0_9EURY|nr:helix-turn-helix domain-containing protein [Halocatena salina]UPM41983.1 helix-turn-helix domain-containing protein [Halocatena salina]
MVTVVWATLPASDFALSETLSVAPDATFECEQIIETGSGTVMPLLWVRGVDRETVERGFERDHSVDGFECLASLGNEGLYRMEWIRQVRLVLQILTSTNATVLDAAGDSEQWTLRIMYPQRSELSETNEFCERHRLSFSVERIRELSEEVVGQYGLTEEQFNALTIACESGYFDVPREVDLDELATELGISHQALSERLRRGHEVLIKETLLIDGSSQFSIRSN